MSTSTRFYCVTCLSTGRMYAGITSRSIAERWKKHCREAAEPKFKFHAAIHQYGMADFVVEELFLYPTRKEAEQAEIDTIHFLDLANTGLNTSLGGDGGNLSEASRSKMARSLAGRKLSSEHRANISAGLLASGRTYSPHSPETKARISAAKFGRRLSSDHRQKIGLSIRGKKRTSLTRARQSAARSAWWARKQINSLNGSVAL